MDMTLAGFVALGALIIGLFTWLRQDIRELRKDLDSKMGESRKDMSTLRNALESKMDSLRNDLESKMDTLRSDLESKMDTLRNDLDSKIGMLREELYKLGERVARIEGMLEAAFRRRDLTPLPEPTPSGDRPDKPSAA